MKENKLYTDHVKIVEPGYIIMEPERALRLLLNDTSYTKDSVQRERTCKCNDCYLCAYQTLKQYIEETMENITCPENEMKKVEIKDEDFIDPLKNQMRSLEDIKNDPTNINKRNKPEPLTEEEVVKAVEDGIKLVHAVDMTRDVDAALKRMEEKDKQEKENEDKMETIDDTIEKLKNITDEEFEKTCLENAAKLTSHIENVHTELAEELIDSVEEKLSRDIFEAAKDPANLNKKVKSETSELDLKDIVRTKIKLSDCSKIIFNIETPNAENWDGLMDLTAKFDINFQVPFIFNDDNDTTSENIYELSLELKKEFIEIKKILNRYFEL